MLPNDNAQPTYDCNNEEPAIFDKNFVFSRANTAKSKQWNRQELTFEQFCDAFSNHREDTRKDGPAFVPGEIMGGERKSTAVTTLYCAVFDIDSGQTYDEVRDILNKHAYEAIMFTTYSHMKTVSHIKTDNFARWAAKHNLEPAAGKPLHTQENIDKYVDEELGPKGRAKLGGTFTVRERLDHTQDGMQIAVDHPPIEKFRIVIPFEQPFIFASHGYTSAEQVQMWKRWYHGIGKHLGLQFDESCADPPRLYYFPSHPPGDKNFRLDHLLSDPENPEAIKRTMLDFHKIQQVEVGPEGVRARGAATGSTATGTLATARERAKSDFDPRLIGWAAKCPKFDFGQLLIDKGLGTEVPGKGVTFECMFQHSTPDNGTKTMVLPTEKGGWHIDCRGESCKIDGAHNRDRLEYVAAFLDSKSLTWGDLQNPAYGGGPVPDAEQRKPDGEADDDKPKKMTKADLRAKLCEDASAVAAMLQLHALQTEDEKFGHGAGQRNGVGFNKGDAKVLGPIIEKWEAGTPLSRNELGVIKRRVAKYAATQLLSRVKELEASADRIEDKLGDMISDEADDLPSAYFRDTDDESGETRIYTMGEKGPIEVCQDFTVVAATLDEKALHGVGFKFTDQHGKQRRYFVKRGVLAGKGTEWLEALHDQGFECYSDMKLRDLLKRVRSEKVALRVTKPGWHLHNGREEFVLPDTERDDIVYAGNVKLVKPDENGSLKKWQDTARLAEGNSRLVFALASGFVSPSLKPLNAEPGGVLYAGKTGEGKSTALWMFSSVWGPGPVSLKTTPTAMETVLEEANDCGVALDELGEMERGAGDLTYMIGNGAGKSRGKPNGERQDVREFRVWSLFSGEMTLADKIESENKRVTGGQETRVITITANAGKGFGIFDKVPRVTGDAAKDGAAFADRIKLECKSNYGLAGPAFVAWVQENRDAVVEFSADVDDVANKLTPPGASPQVRRIARRFALVAVAGELAILAKVLPLEAGSVIEAVQRLFEEWLEQRGGTDQSEALEGARRVLEYMRRHPREFQQILAGNTRAENGAPVISDMPMKRMGYTDPDGLHLWLPEAFKEVAGGNVSEVAKHLSKIGALKRKQKRLKMTRTIDGVEGEFFCVRLPPSPDALAAKAWLEHLAREWEQPEDEGFEYDPDAVATDDDAMVDAVQ